MRVNVAVSWDRAPARGRFEFINAQYVGGGLNIGWGDFSRDDFSFSFTSTNEPCRICLGLDVEDTGAGRTGATMRVVDTATPFVVSIDDVLAGEDGTLRLAAPGVTVEAEIDAWASL